MRSAEPPHWRPDMPWTGGPAETILREATILVRDPSMGYRDDYYYDEDDEYFDGDSDFGTGEYDTASDEEDGEEPEDTIPPSPPSGDRGVDISMEVDEEGNELWVAEDSRIPGSSSIGHSLDEAMDGVEERRKQYREMLRRSRERRQRRDEERNGD